MESLTPSRQHRSPIKSSLASAAARSPAEATDQISTPEKPIQEPRRTRSRSVAAAARSPLVATVSDQISTPGKPIQGPRRTLSRSVAAAARSPLEATLSDQISTPGNPIQGPRRTRSRSVVFSVKEVKNVALGLRRPLTESTGRSDLARSDDNLSSITDKISTKPSKSKTPIKLAEKYETLAEFFNGMVSSIQLLRLKGSASTFPNICSSIQHLTERRFTYGHLAQLKYVLPEVISIKKVHLRDEVTCCIKPELQMALQIGAIESKLKRKEESDISLLVRVFRERLVKFSEDHPQGDDVPQESLPHPFNQTKATLPLKKENDTTNTLQLDPLSNILPHQQLFVHSHMPGSFRRRFSQKSPLAKEEKTSLACLNKPSPKDDHFNYFFPPNLQSSKPPINKESLLGSPIPSPSESTPTADEKKTKVLMSNQKYSSEGLDASNGTPAKLVSTPLRLMTNTPEIQTPKRYQTTMPYDSPPAKRSDKRSARTKLFTTPKKKGKTDDQEAETSSLSSDKDVISFLPANLLQSIREKENKALEEREAGVAEEKRRQKLISSLHNIFDMILLLFQSMQRSSMTKQQLIHKIIASNYKVIDRGEVEEQLKLLQELVPDWIYEKVVASGDVLYCVDKMSSPEEIRQRLAEAKCGASKNSGTLFGYHEANTGKHQKFEAFSNPRAHLPEI